MRLLSYIACSGQLPKKIQRQSIHEKFTITFSVLALKRTKIAIKIRKTYTVRNCGTFKNKKNFFLPRGAITFKIFFSWRLKDYLKGEKFFRSRRPLSLPGGSISGFSTGKWSSVGERVTRCFSRLRTLCDEHTSRKIRSIST